MKRFNQISTFPYHLKPDSFHDFYNDLQCFTDSVLLLSTLDLKHEIKSFMSFSENNEGARNSTYEEQLLSLISIGVFLEQYEKQASQTLNFSFTILTNLTKLRKNNPEFKPVVDPLRGFGAYLFLKHKPKANNNFNFESFKRLILWMEASGEFAGQVERISQWQPYFASLREIQVSEILTKAVQFSHVFYFKGKNSLSRYFKNLETSRNSLKKHKRFREDYFFCTKNEVEYFLNVFGAEILNRCMKEEFIKTSQKVVLLPTCMVQPENGKCKAKIDKTNYQCVNCTTECSVNQIQIEGLETGYSVALIPHSTGFSTFLKRWQGQKTTGLIGVACILNLLSGGYEMQKLGIPSQCVFLDFPGCRKHWNRAEVSTRLNRKELAEKIQIPVARPEADSSRSILQVRNYVWAN